MNHQAIPTLAEAKAGAKHLRQRLKELGTDVGHSIALEATSAAFRYPNWATFRSAIEARTGLRDEIMKGGVNEKADLVTSAQARLSSLLSGLDDRDFYTTARELMDIVAGDTVDALGNPALFFVIHPEAQGDSRGSSFGTIKESMRATAIWFLVEKFREATWDDALRRFSQNHVAPLLGNPDFFRYEGSHTPFGKGPKPGLTPLFADEIDQKNVSPQRLLKLSDKDFISRLAAVKPTASKDIELVETILNQLLGIGLLNRLYRGGARDVVRDFTGIFFGDHKRLPCPTAARYVDPKVFDDFSYYNRGGVVHAVGKGYRYAIRLPRADWDDHQRRIKEIADAKALPDLRESWSSYTPFITNYRGIAPAYLLFRNPGDAAYASSCLDGTCEATLDELESWDTEEQRSNGVSFATEWENALGYKPKRTRPPLDD